MIATCVRLGVGISRPSALRASSDEVDGIVDPRRISEGIPVLRSYLFVPGNRPDRYEKACATRADAVIVDLEDAVAPHDKAEARESLVAWLAAARKVIVRVNAPGSAWWDDDLAACAHDGVRAVVVPKAEQPSQMALAASVTGKPVLPLVETAQGAFAALEIARTPGVSRLLFGSLDYQADLDTSDDELLYVRSRLVLVSRVAGIEAPVDGITQAADDVELVRRDSERARRLGFGGKLCIHPRQVDLVNRAFCPSDEDVEWATRVVAAFEASRGNAALLDGKMVDRPVLMKAQAILGEAAARRGGHAPDS
jgi:citrate lyase subunit beta/citryl-CoA lyase